LLCRYVPVPEETLAVRMAGDRGVSSLLSTTVCDFWRRCCAGEAMQSMQMEHALLALVGAAYADMQGEPTLRSVSRSRVLAYIESHLREPALDLARIGNAVGMTTRNVHYVFESEHSETVGRYILRRRLEEAAYAIANAPAKVKLTALAADCGFSSATHFGRAFREKFGVTPTEYRLRSRNLSTK
jgi:AraC-like DNA-binding protein